MNMKRKQVIQKLEARFANLRPEEIKERLERNGAHTFLYEQVWAKAQSLEGRWLELKAIQQHVEALKSEIIDSFK